MTKRSRNVFCIAAVLASCLCNAAVAGVKLFNFETDGESLVLAERGKAAGYAIVVPADAGESMRYAASELSRYVRKITGVELPVTRRGNGEALPEKAVVLELWDGGPDAFRIHAKGQRVYVSGGVRGVLYGVYELLEAYGGIGWFASWHEVVPESATFAVPADIDREEHPAFEMREPYFFDAFDGDFAARLRINGLMARLQARHGGKAPRFGGGLGSCHTFGRLVPPKEFFEDHPEYFSLVNGKRIGNGQLCLSNTNVLRIVTERVLAAIRRDPTAKYYGVSQSDNTFYCQCPDCAAVDAEEESHAGTVVRFVNAVAEAVEKEFPGKVIETLAYQYSRKPPKKTRLRHNVMPCLCSIECDFSRPLATSPAPQNIAFVRDMRGWAEQTDMLYVWDYVVNFRHYTHAFPNILAMVDNLRLFRDCGVRSVFAQGDLKGRHAWFAELKVWLLAKLMWNPDQPVEPLLDRFFAGYYGEAAPYARAYFDMAHRLQREWAGDAPDRKMGIYEGIPSPALGDDFLEKAEALWGKAMDAVADGPEVYRYNVRMSAFSDLYTRFMQQKRRLVVTRTPEKFGCFPDFAERAAWLSRCAAEGKIRVAENGDSIANFKRRLKEAEQAADGNAAVTADVGLIIWQPKLAERVKDPSAEEGASIFLPNTHFAWAARFPMARVAYDEGEEYVIRVRLRAEVAKDAPPNAEVFWALAYDGTLKKIVGGERSLKVGEVKDGWAWYDVCRVKLNDNMNLWIGPGRFDIKANKTNPAHSGVWVDAVEIARADFKNTKER